jgi:hypothetical protein
MVGWVTPPLGSLLICTISKYIGNTHGCVCILVYLLVLVSYWCVLSFLISVKFKIEIMCFLSSWLHLFFLLPYSIVHQRRLRLTRETTLSALPSWVTQCGRGEVWRWLFFGCPEDSNQNFKRCFQIAQYSKRRGTNTLNEDCSATSTHIQISIPFLFINSFPFDYLLQ